MKLKLHAPKHLQALEQLKRLADIDTVYQPIILGNIVARQLVEQARASMMRRKTGRVYKNPRGGTYRASAPTESPAYRTGTLYASVGYQVRRDEVQVGYGATYGRFLELGTSRMQPRPNLKPIGDAAFPLFERYVTGALRGLGLL